MVLVANNKYLLYIDILGFSNLVFESEKRVIELYNIIDSLNCHNHDAFKTIVFSDTMLVYNIDYHGIEADDRYLVMFLIEFAQNLLYQTIGKDYYFRATLVYGEFIHSTPDKVERFYGKALIDAYNKEKQIIGTGLYIDDRCNKYNNIFKTEKYNNDLSFVYLTQSMDRILMGYLGDFPYSKFLTKDMDMFYGLKKDIKMFKTIYYLKDNHPDPKVRAKHQSTWSFYEKRYSTILKGFVDSDFKIKKIFK